MQSPQMLFDSFLSIDVISGSVGEHCGKWWLECRLLCIKTGAEYPSSFVIWSKLNSNQKQKMHAWDYKICEHEYFTPFQNLKNLKVQLTLAQEFLPGSQI